MLQTDGVIGRLGSRARSVLVALVVVAPLVAVVPAWALPPADAVATGVAPAAAERVDVKERLARLPIVAGVTELKHPGPARFFRLRFRLPVDHDRPGGRTFTLRGTLLHSGVGRPMVMAASGYYVSTWNLAYRYEVTRIVKGNQLDLEHRFFKPSRPRKPRWHSQLTIGQAAADQHRIVWALQRIYGKPWISTGASKGGMTMTYHRRTYPGDVAGTVAFVAPNDVVDDVDAYDDFQASVGGPSFAGCRNRLVALQRRLLTEREWFRGRLVRWARHHDQHLTLVGSADRALEVAAIETYYAFWQYQSAASACSDVPTATARRGRVWSWVDDVLGWRSVTDEGIRPFVPYYFQAATQLGAPAPWEDEVADLLRYPGHDVPATFVPDGLEPLAHDPAAMPDIDEWVRTSASRMLFVYGELDPWSAEPFACGPGGAARECYQRWVPGGNHFADIRDLPDAARRATVSRIRAWAGVSTSRAAVEAADRRARRAGPDPSRDPARTVATP